MTAATKPKLPTETELDAFRLEWLTPPERADVKRIILLGREYYALRARLRELAAEMRDAPAGTSQAQREVAEAAAEEIEALLGEEP